MKSMQRVFLPTHDDLRAMNTQAQASLQEFSLDSLHNIAATATENMLVCVQEAITQHEGSLKMHFEQLMKCAETTGELSSRQLKRENGNVLAAVNGIQADVSVSSDKFDLITQSMAEVNTDLLFEGLEHLMKGTIGAIAGSVIGETI
jgi:hypothetical protein